MGKLRLHGEEVFCQKQVNGRAGTRTRVFDSPSTAFHVARLECFEGEFI